MSTNPGTDYYAACSRLALSDYVDSSIPNGEGAVNFKEGIILKNNTKHKYHSVTSGGGGD